jgi:branched-chain amino acid transport system ATP-binding protein
VTVVEEAMLPGDPVSSLRRMFRRQGDVEVHDLLEKLGLAEVADRRPSELSQGQRKMISVARVLAGQPRVLCMDEPAAGLSMGESVTLGRRLRTLVDEGLGILLVDHDVGLVLSVCDVIYVLDFGSLIAFGPPEKIRTDEHVVSAYLGDSALHHTSTQESAKATLKF